MSEQFSIPTPGDMVAGKYRVIEELGRGSYGVVFRARQDDIDRDVALKTLLPQAFLQADIVERFKREAQLISRLDHPNIIRLYDYGVDEGLLYMAVEYVEGRTLQELMDDEAPLGPEQVTAIAAQILAALESAHDEGIVHRDLKPDNIVLLRSRPSEGVFDETVKVLDFGIAKLIAGEKEESALKTLTQSGTVLGTPYYMSPENIVGDPVDHRADLYAMGIMLYEMLVGSHPFDANSPSAVMVRHLRDDAPELPEAVRATHLGAAIRRALEKQPHERIGSAREMRELLLSTEPPPKVRPTMSAEVLAPGTISRGPLIALVAVLLLVLVASVAWKVRSAFDAIDGEGGEAEATVLAPAPVGDEAVASGEVAGEAAAPAAPDDDGADDDDDGALVFEVPELLDGDGDGDGTPPADAVAAAEEPSVDAEPGGEDDTAPRARAAANRRPRRSAPQEPAPEAATDTVRLSIDSSPNNASVMVNGTQVGYTPLKYAVTSGTPVVIRLSHIGYKNETFRLTPTEDEVVQARLEKDRIKLID